MRSFVACDATARGNVKGLQLNMGWLCKSQFVSNSVLYEFLIQSSSYKSKYIDTPTNLAASFQIPTKVYWVASPLSVMA